MEELYQRIDSLCREYLEQKKLLNNKKCNNFYKSFDVNELQNEESEMILEKNKKYNSEYVELRNKYNKDKSKFKNLFYLVMGIFGLSTCMFVLNKIFWFLILFIMSIVTGKYLVESIDKLDRKYCSDINKIGNEYDSELEELENRVSFGLFVQDKNRDEIELIEKYIEKLESEITRLVIKGFDLFKKDEIVSYIDNEEYREFERLINERKRYDQNGISLKKFDSMNIKEFLEYREMLNVNREIAYYVANSLYRFEEFKNVDNNTVGKRLVRKRNI